MNVLLYGMNSLMRTVGAAAGVCLAARLLGVGIVLNAAASLPDEEHECDFPPSWTARYRTLDPDDELAVRIQNQGRPLALAPDGAGGLYVTGTGFYPPEDAEAAFTVRFDAEGNRLWAAVHHASPAHNSTTAHAIAVDSARNVIVAGDCRLPADDGWRSVYSVVKYTRSGLKLWSTRFKDSCGNLGNSSAYSVDTDESGDI